MPGLFLSVVSLVPHNYCLVDSSSPICASSLDVYLLLCWRWFGVLVLALQVGSAWLMQPGFKARGMAGLCTPQQGRMLFTGRWCWALYRVFDPKSPRDTGISYVILCKKTGVGKACKHWLWAHVVLIKIIFLFNWCGTRQSPGSGELFPAPPRWRIQTHKLLCVLQVCFINLKIIHQMPFKCHVQ